MRITRSIVPNLFTLANLFSGFSAIILTSEGKFKEAAVFILIAGIFDMLDGVMARLTKSTSELGVELDSLCDAVSFGVAPAFMLYKVEFYDVPTYGILLAALPALAGVFRLARFNAQLSSLEDKLYFTGMPIPAGALTIVSYIVFFHAGEAGQILSNWGMVGNSKSIVLGSVTIAVSLAMVSRIKYDNMPRPSVRSIKRNPVKFLFFIAGVIAGVITKGVSVFPFMMIYIIAGALRQGIVWIQARNNRDEDEELE
ncbi:MAG: CDP-diacylglycerol--serine O-phosphatidyltransferase [Ignavibacteriae bacterium]|nr:CDP-diacylglycerol--serine O-phosphatidyltransferase [Ignavibacteriota bacterium]